MRGKAYDLGVRGEQQAEAYLCSLGMACVARRWRAAGGELDLIMLDGETVVFVEVKYRPHSPPGSGLTAVTRDKRRRMARAAAAFLIEREWTDRFVRFDIIEISGQGVRYVPNAFQPGFEI